MIVPRCAAAQAGRCRAAVGERLYGAAPFGKWGTQTFIAGLTQDALITPWVIKGAMNGLAFDTYIETQLAPVLDPGTVVILDNLSTHKSPRAAEALRRHGCWYLFLPAYSPDLNRSKWRFPSSRPICGASAPEPSTRCSKLLAISVTCSTQTNAGTSSKLPDMPQIKCKTL